MQSKKSVAVKVVPRFKDVQSLRSFVSAPKLKIKKQRSTVSYSPPDFSALKLLMSIENACEEPLASVSFLELEKKAKKLFAEIKHIGESYDK